MKYNRGKLAKSGFTLAEMLVALAVTAVVGSAALFVMLSASGIWRTVFSGTSEISELDAFDADFSRDFASSSSMCGFSGSSTGCTFTTYMPGNGGAIFLESVSYSLVPGKIVSSRGDVYRTSAVESFVYNVSTNLPSEDFSDTFSSTNSSPLRIAVSLSLPSAALEKRFYVRVAE